MIKRLSANYSTESWAFAEDGSLLSASFGSDYSEYCDQSSSSLRFGEAEIPETCREVRDPSAATGCSFDPC